jgi:3',5'-cyclic AMP phosphodiesterase CpdA
MVAVAATVVAVVLLIANNDFAPAGRGGTPFVRSVPGTSAAIWAVGDGADGGANGRAVAELIAADAPDRVLYLGDVYELGTAEEFRRNYDTTYGPLARVTAPTPGNHDWLNAERGYDPYWRRALGRRTAHWYSFRAAGWQILSLNSEASHGVGSVQHRWLRRQVRRPGSCRMAFWHRPRFSAGTTHGDQPDVAPLWDALRGRAAIVLAGHEHDMQRFKPVDGITQFVSGAGGHHLYRLRSGDPRLAFGDDRTFGALRLWLQRGRAEYAFFAVDGRVLDAGTLRCRPVR